MTRAWLLLLGLGACDRVFGLERSIDASAETAPPVLQVSGRIAYMETRNDPSGNPSVITTLYDAPQLTAILDDGSTPSVTYDSQTGAYAFERAAFGQPYRLHLVTSLSDLEYQMATPTLDIVDRTIGRAERIAPTAATALVDSVTTPAAVFARVVTTGAPTETQIGAAGATIKWSPQPVPGDPTEAGAIGRLGLPEAAMSDRVYVNSFKLFTAEYYAVAASFTMPLTLGNGSATPLMGAAVALSPNLCVRIMPARDTEYARIAARVMPAFPAGGTDWQVTAAPGRDALYGLGGSLISLAAKVASASELVQLQLSNPFPGTQLVASAGVGFQRSYLAPTATTMAIIQAGTRMYVPMETAPTCATAPTVVVPLGSAFPTIPVLANTPLSSEGMSVALTSVDPTVSWSYGPGEHPDIATASLVEIVADPGKHTQLVTRTSVRTTGSSAVFARASFQSGRSYLIRIDAAMGYPGASTGDLTLFGWPQATATNWSAMFTVP